MIDLKQDYFTLFDIATGFTVDLEMLQQRYQALLKQTHPDKFAGGDERQQRQALQLASFVNQAYKTLYEPLSRAQYLLQLAGCELANAGQLPAAFLMEQIELREALAEIRQQSDPLATADQLKQRLQTQLAESFEIFAADYAQARWTQATEMVNKLQFFIKLEQELADLVYELEEELI